MKTTKLILFTFVLINIFLLQLVPSGNAQQSSIQLPVELVGFPVIILAVRLSNFVKKLAYSLNPSTYISRSKRGISNDDMIDMLEAEKRLVSELGENVCIYTRVCLLHADKAKKSIGKKNYSVNWDEVFSHYKTTSDKNKEFYLLSIFLGDFIASPKFCNLLAKRGRACND
ncbi:uncharacterized protein [Onthophagus taurus]|uniref:uncharacterized protein n=1 Tax=Onthophagus taurus TaxID=166361 RepID=UPI000C20F134|nr:uncharacterized protein LOC111425629 [Onthophagus taurus]